MKNIALLFIAAPLVAACSSAPSTEDTLRSHGYSQNYVAGYHSGCESGKHAGGDLFSSRVQDSGAYSAGGDYKNGWDYGFLTCNQKQVQDLAVATAVSVGIAMGQANSHGSDGIDAQKALNGMDTSAIQAAGW